MHVLRHPRIGTNFVRVLQNAAEFRISRTSTRMNIPTLEVPTRNIKRAQCNIRVPMSVLGGRFAIQQNNPKVLAM